MHLECNYFLYIQTRFSYIVHTVMEWVAYKSPTPLQTQVLYMFFCICNGILPSFYAVTALLKIFVEQKSWQMPRARPFPLASDKAFSSCVYRKVICRVTADIAADILLPYMYSWLCVKLKLCQYKVIMVSRRAQNQAKGTLKQPYQTIVSIEFRMAALLVHLLVNWNTWAGTVNWNLHSHLL